MRRPKSPLAGILDTFNRVEIVYYWKESRSVQPLGDVTLLDDYAPVKRDLDKATYGRVSPRGRAAQSRTKTSPPPHCTTR